MFLITPIDTHEITSQIVVHDAIENARGLNEPLGLRNGLHKISKIFIKIRNW